MEQKQGLTFIIDVGSKMPPTFDSRRLYVSSPLFSPLILASIRLLFAVYTLTVLVYVLVWYNINSSGGRFFSYFTQLTQIGLCAYFWASAVQGFGFLRHNQKWYPLQKWGRVLQALHVILHASIIVFPILVTIVYWVLLADANTFDGTYRAWSTISLHALNSVYALFEIFLTNSPPSPWWTIIPLELMLGGYLGVAYLTEATQGWYPYAFLDPSEHSAGVLAGYIVGIAVGNIVVFLIVRGAVVLRMKVAVRSGRLPAVTVDEDLAEGHQSQKPVGLV